MRGQRPELLLTGRREGKTYLVEVHGVEVRLSERLFCALCELAAARLAPGAPPLPLPKGTVFRLRRALNLATSQKDFGKELIWPATKHKYVLALPAGEIIVDPSFEDVLLTGCLGRGVADHLLAAAPARVAGKTPGSLPGPQPHSTKRGRPRVRRDV